MKCFPAYILFFLIIIPSLLFFVHHTQTSAVDPALTDQWESEIQVEFPHRPERSALRASQAVLDMDFEKSLYL